MSDAWVLLLLLFGGRKGDRTERPRRELPLEVTPPASEAPAPSTRAPSTTEAPSAEADAQSLSYQSRWAGLARRARGGDSWVGILGATAPPRFSDPRWAAGIARLIGIESNGQPTARSELGEIGLLQIRRQFAVGPGKLTAAEFDSYGRATTARSELARISWKIVAHLDGRAPDAWIPNIEARLWRIGMRHGLPALLDDLASKGYIVPADARGPAPNIVTPIDEAPATYEPSALVARFAARRPVRGALDDPQVILHARVGWRVLVRFVTRADVIAGWRRGVENWP